jgi:hypothetical protein
MTDSLNTALSGDNLFTVVGYLGDVRNRLDPQRLEDVVDSLDHL